MVWALFPADPLSGEDKYYIFTKGTYKVGRKGCDVIINKDKGVSRIHAEIIVDEMVSLNSVQRKNECSTNVRVRDCSKYGTFIHKNSGPKEKVHEFPNKETVLKDGELVSFGAGNTIYRFSFVPLIFFVYCSESSQILQEKVSSIGAHITCRLIEECTHILVDQQMPLNKDIIDAIVAKKPIILWSWVALVAEQGITSEIPSWTSYIPTVTVGGVSVRVVDSTTRTNCLTGYSFILESVKMYKFGVHLQSLLELGGANVIFTEEFCSSSQGLDYVENLRMVCVIPQGSVDKFVHFSKLRSLSRVNEVDVLCAVISGHLDSSKLILPTVLVSSTCSTDETVVADSDEELEITSVDATANVYKEESPKCENKVENSSVQHPSTKLEDTHVSSITGYHDEMIGRMEVDEPESTKGCCIASTTLNHGGMVGKREVDVPESTNSDIIYSQDLIIRVLHLPASIRSTPNDGALNFKRFKKKTTVSGNSFNNLIPFSKYPYKDSDNGNQEMVESMKEERKRKQMEAIAEDLFNNEKGRRRGGAGSLRSILSHG